MSLTMPKETGMLDVGTHCAFCRQLDFLPFHCSYCNKDFCSTHRVRESHLCSSLTQKSKVTASNIEPLSSSKPIKSNNETFFKSLLPEKASIRVAKGNANAKAAGSTDSLRTTIQSTLDTQSKNRILSFFRRHRSSNNGSSGSRSALTNKYTGKALQLRAIKLDATLKGDSKVPEQNRVYLYAYGIDSDEGKNNDEGRQRVAVYVNKVWPVGRALDYIASVTHLKNSNLKAGVSSDQKLFMYRFDSKGNQLVQLEFSARVGATLKDLDTVYVARGTEVKQY